MTITGYFLIAITILTVVLDIVLPPNGQPTESQVLRDWAWRWNTIPFIAGFLIGHWFGNRYTVSYSAWGYALGFIVAELLTDVAVRLWAGPYELRDHPLWRWFRHPLFHALAGIPIGMFLWGQSYQWSPF